MHCWFEPNKKKTISDIMRLSSNDFLLLTCFIIAILNIKCNKISLFKKVTVEPNGTLVLNDELDTTLKNSRFLLAITIKDNAHSLPTFLATLEEIKCPNADKKCDLWLIFDRCLDNSYEIFTNWLSKTRLLFDTILMIDTNNDEKTKKNHPELGKVYFSRNKKIRALAYAIDKKFDYILFLNGDSILTNPEAIEILARKKKAIVAPLLTSSETQHSTFSIKSHDEDSTQKFYSLIYDRYKIGCFKVNAVKESYLMDLKNPKLNQYFQQNLGQLSDDEDISKLAKNIGLSMFVCNRDYYGYIPDLIEDRNQAFIHLRIDHLLKGPNKTYNKPLKISKNIDYDIIPKMEKTKLGFDEIYVINLERRSDRRERIESALDDLGISFKTMKAIDGRLIDEEYLNKLGIKSLPKYKDPYTDRPLNFGEIGCFLSHYFIWQEMITKNYQKIIILEDDAKFALNFKNILKNLMKSISQTKLSWDLLYLGRKIMNVKEEDWNLDVVPYKNFGLIQPAYSHWTVAYALSLSGSQKLLANEPLKKLLPVDEYLPIMFDKQPNEYWTSFFPKRDIVAYAIQPPVIFPTHYTGEPSHISDTEQTQLLDTSKFENDAIDTKNTNDILNLKHQIHMDL